MENILGGNIEPFESVLLVEQYRRFWKPKNRVKTILLAESHVFTREKDRELEFNIPALNDYPREYAKFVYCLAYGESELTESSADHGTSQFWRMFFSCLNRVNSKDDFAPILKSKTATLLTRISNKVKLLRDLQEKGIWLVDVSICALYDGGKKPKSSLISKAIKTSWSCYTKDVVTLLS